MTTRNTREIHIRSSSNKPDVLFRHVERRGLVGEKTDELKMLDERDRQSLMPYLCARVEGCLGVEGMMYGDVRLVRWSWLSKMVGRGEVGRAS